MYWKYHNMKTNIFYLFVIFPLICGALITLLIKKKKKIEYNNKILVISHLFVTFGLIMLVIYHCIHTKWLFGAILCGILCLVNFYIFYQNVIKYINNNNRQK